MLRVITTLALAALTLITAACGGGAGGNGGPVASAPPPAPSPSPAPTPTPTPAPPPATTTYSTQTGVNAAVSNPVTATETFAAVGTTIATGSANSARTVPTGEVTIGRDASGGYSITVPVRTAVGTEIVRTLQFASNTRYVDPRISSENSSYAARQDASSTQASGDRILDLKSGFAHLAFAEINLCNSASGAGCGEVDRFTPPARIALVFGQATPSAEIPLTGSASYSGKFDTISVVDPLSTLGGSLLLSVDFATRGLTGKLSEINGFDARCDISPCTFVLPDFTVSGALAANGALSGTIATPSGSVFTGGSWTGMFFGPGAAELGGSLLLSQPDGGYAGVFGAKRQ